MCRWIDYEEKKKTSASPPLHPPQAPPPAEPPLYPPIPSLTEIAAGGASSVALIQTGFAAITGGVQQIQQFLSANPEGIPPDFTANLAAAVAAAQGLGGPQPPPPPPAPSV